MLVLTRCKGDSIQIGDDIEITISATKGNSVRLKIDAPREIPVYREELYLRIADEPDEFCSNSLRYANVTKR